MPYDDEELRREALMRMAMPEMGMETVDYSPDYEQEQIIKQNPLGLTEPGNDPNHPYNKARDRYENEYRSFMKKGGTSEDTPNFYQYLDSMYPGRIKKEPSSPVPPPKQKGMLDSAAESIYGILPGAPGLKAGTDPLLKRKGLGR